MRREHIRRIAAVPVAALAATLVAVAVVNARDASTSRHSTTLRYVVRFLPPAGVDNPPRGFSPGDNVIFAGEALDRGNRRVGTHQGFCTVTIPGQALQCSSTTEIARRGQLVAEGNASPGGAGTIAVVGGTGDFKGARGQRLLVERPRSGRELVSDVTFSLVTR